MTISINKPEDKLYSFNDVPVGFSVISWKNNNGNQYLTVRPVPGGDLWVEYKGNFHQYKPDDISRLDRIDPVESLEVTTCKK